MAYLEWVSVGFIILIFIAYRKLSRLKFHRRKILNFRNRVLIALVFPILLIFLIFFGGIVFLMILGIIILVFVLFLLFWIFGRRKIYYRKL